MLCKRHLSRLVMSVHLSLSYILSKWVNICTQFFRHFSFSVPNGTTIFWWELPKRGVECRSRFWAYIWLHCIRSTLQPARCYEYGAAGAQSIKLWHSWDNDEVFMTRSLNITPKTTEQHLVAHSDKSVAYVTNNKRLSTFCTIEANYWQTWSIAWHLCDSRATC